MKSNLPPIYFYLPQSKWPDPMPQSFEYLRPKDGVSSWILQTYLRLLQLGFPCQLISEIPHEGILIGHRESFNYELKPEPKLFLVCVKGDQNCLPYAQLHIVQNKWEVNASPIKIQSISEERYLLPGKRYYMPHWPQPGLIPRHQERGDTFENVVYFGITYNLAPPLRQSSWQQTVENLGLRWCPETNGDRWHDYSNVDVIVAVRSFDRRNSYPWKPATKLYQAWHAEVPAILGPESAFQAERKSELDYLEVTSVAELVDALKRLKNDLGLRQAMVENGQERAKETESEVLTKYWRDFITDICVPAYEQWCQTSVWDRKRFFISRYVSKKLINIQQKLLS
ncbi:conserved hypothetical protein [Rippkaea orientalis PCC 8801]|uniref:Glycosyltransferase family 1 protein n=1 Tax=Rippkaea orientalis (strain PCC 8801 / RF-1) TaxID=41431 RepID=B7K315_RIPO1|nr:glycosyltransferase [Rippkaea orientalis]ACK67716.1 conserved hypothetical protein [Rippkaea orientalis PCC 8801]